MWSHVTEPASSWNQDNHNYSEYGWQNSTISPNLLPSGIHTVSSSYSITDYIWNGTLLLSCSVILTNVLNFPNSVFSSVSKPHGVMAAAGAGVWDEEEGVCIAPSSFRVEWVIPRLPAVLLQLHVTDQLESEVTWECGDGQSQKHCADNKHSHSSA